MTEEQQSRVNPEDAESAIRLFRYIIANEWEKNGDQKADLKYVNPVLLREDEMKLYVRLQELLKKDREGVLSFEEADRFAKEIRVFVNAAPEWCRRAGEEELLSRRDDPTVSRHAFHQYIGNEFNAPYMRAQEREEVE